MYQAVCCTSQISNDRTKRGFEEFRMFTMHRAIIKSKKYCIASFEIMPVNNGFVICGTIPFKGRCMLWPTLRTWHHHQGVHHPLREVTHPLHSHSLPQAPTEDYRHDEMQETDLCVPATRNTKTMEITSVHHDSDWLLLNQLCVLKAVWLESNTINIAHAAEVKFTNS